MKKFWLLLTVLLILAGVNCRENGGKASQTGFASDQIFGIIGDNDPSCELEITKKFSSFFGEGK